MPPNATRCATSPRPARRCSRIPRWFYAIFAIDLTTKKYAKATDVRRGRAPLRPVRRARATSPASRSSQQPVEVYAIFGGQWPHSSFMIPGGVMCAPTLSDITRSIAILDYWRREWLEKRVARLLGRALPADQDVGATVLAWMRRERVAAQQRPRLLHPLLDGDRPRQVRRGLRQLPRHRHVLRARACTRPRPSTAATPRCITRSGIYADGAVPRLRPGPGHRGRHALVLQGHRLAAPVGGRHRARSTRPTAAAQGKYTWAKAPRYDVPGPGPRAARGRPAGPPDDGRPPRARPRTRTTTRSFRDMIAKIGPSVLLRVLARMHEAPKYYQMDPQVDRRDRPARRASTSSRSSPSRARASAPPRPPAARSPTGSCIEDGKIANYQVITPTAWNIGPRDGERSQRARWSRRFIGAPVEDLRRPGRARPRRAQLRLLPRVHGARLRRQDRRRS